MSLEVALNAPKETEDTTIDNMSERTTRVSKTGAGLIEISSIYGVSIYLPEDEIDAIMEDIKNLR